MAFLSTIEKRILRLDKHIAVKYALAVRESLQVDLNLQDGKIPNIMNADDIAKRYGIGIDALLNYKVLLDNTTAAEFLEEVGYEIKPRAFRGRFHRSKLAEAFGDDSVVKTRGDRGKLVFTYGQVLHLVKQIHIFELPDGLQRLVDGK